MKRVAILILGLVPAIAVHAQNWPSFRGERASGVANGKPTPTKWDAVKGENVLWKVSIPGLSLASPVVWGDRVFIVTAISSDAANEKSFRHGLYGDVEPHADMAKHTWKVYALDKRTGKIIWERVAYEGVPKTKRHPKSSQASSTPATDGKHIVAFFGSQGLYTFDWKGTLLWSKDLGPMNAGWFYDPDYEWGSASSPIIYKNMAIVQCDIQKNSFIAAIDLKTGKQIWRTERDEIPSWGTPTIYENPATKHNELITHATKFIRGYDPMTGKELWRLGPNSEVTAPTPFVAHDLIFVTNGYRFIQPIYAIKPGARGDISLKGDALYAKAAADIPAELSAAVPADYKAQATIGVAAAGPPLAAEACQPAFADILGQGNGDSGILTVYNAKTGERVYQQRIGNGGAYSASVVAADGKIYFSSEDGDIFVVRAGPKYELLAQNPMGEVLMATPAISDGIIFVRGINNLYAIAEPTVKTAPFRE